MILNSLCLIVLVGCIASQEWTYNMGVKQEGEKLLYWEIPVEQVWRWFTITKAALILTSNVCILLFQN